MLGLESLGLGSVPILGPILGTGAGIFEAVMGYKAKKRDLEHELAMQDKAVALMEAESSARIEFEKVEQETRQIEADKQTYLASVAHDQAGAVYSKGWQSVLITTEKLSDGTTVTRSHILAKLVAFGLGNVDIMRGSVRPVLTIYFAALSGWQAATTGTVEPNVAMYTGTLLTWWFGSKGGRYALDKIKPQE